MAAPMGNSMLLVIKISKFNKPCFQTKNVICKWTVRHVATTTRNWAREIRRRQTNIAETNESTKHAKKKTETETTSGGGGGGRYRQEVQEGESRAHDHRELSVSAVSGRSDHERRLDDNQQLQRRSDFDSEDEEREGLRKKISYEKARVDDKRIGRMMMIVKSRKYREQSGRVMIEGRRLISDAINSGVQAHTLFFSQLQSLEGIPLHKTRAALVKVPFSEITMWSDVVTPQGVIGVFKKPTHENTLHSQSSVLPLTLICDNIREPGNLGTILRSAVAAQCQKILLTKGCVDVWEPKVLRSGAGAHFHMPIIANVPWKEMTNYLDEDVTVHVADNNTSASIDHLGMSPSKRKRNHGGAFQRKLMEESQEEVMDLPVLKSEVYHNINWRAKSALVIGGETEGLSYQALETCDQTSGCRVHIPMAEVVDSLNAAVSASVILFEALRQNLTQGRT